MERLRDGHLDAILIATEVPGMDMVSVPIFDEPFLAVLPVGHRLAGAARVTADDLAPDMLVLADGHCLRDQALAACSRRDAQATALRASSLETLINMVAAGYGTTLVPALAAEVLSAREVAVRRLADGAARMVRLVSRRGFRRGPALDALADLVRDAAGAANGDAGGRIAVLSSVG